MGTMQPRAVPFAHWFEGQFITIPSFPAWVCDICGERQYDSAALEQLELILGPEADLRRETAHRAPRGTASPAPASRAGRRHRA